MSTEGSVRLKPSIDKCPKCSSTNIMIYDQ